MNIPYIQVQFVGSEGKDQLARLNVASLKQAIEWALQVGQNHHKLSLASAWKCRLVHVGSKADGSDRDEAFFLIDGSAEAMAVTLHVILRKLKAKDTPLVWLDLRNGESNGKVVLSRAYACEGESV